MQMPQALVQMSESDSIPIKVGNNSSGELGKMQEDKPSPIKESSVIYRTSEEVFLVICEI